MPRSVNLSDAEQITVNVATGAVIVTYKSKSALSETDLLTIGGETAFSALKAIFATPDVQTATVVLRSDWTDQLGNTKEEDSTWARLTRATAQKINWDGLEGRVLSDNKHFFCISDARYIHPAIYARLKDKGCLAR